MLALFLALVAPLGSQAAESPDPGRFERVELHRGFDRPMELAVLPDGRVLVVELAGVVKLWSPSTGAVVEAGRIPVWVEQENGLLGIALDPGFAENGWVYVVQSPPQFSGQELARYTLVGDELDPQSEVVLFAFVEQRRECCHHAGSLAFGPDGDLFLATGDNTHPHGDSEGYAPLDERQGREPWNAANTSGDPFSANGKVLRIRPQPDGSYTIPPGNLFPPDGSQGLPEIYVMGCRNPWRISVDPRNGVLYWGDVGPDAGSDGPRGPRGYDEVNRADAAGNFGWPFFIANNRAYVDYDYTSQEVGAAFDPTRPVNPSRLIQGPRDLPPAEPAWIFYPYGASEEFPELDAPGGRTACAGPVYVFDPALDSNVRFPEWFDGSVLIYEWSRHWIQVVHADEQGTIQSIEPLPAPFTYRRPVDMEYGPDGALYVLEFGETWGTNPDSKLVRIEYWSGNRAPTARITAEARIGAAPFEARLSGAGSIDRDGDELSYAWRLLAPEGSEEPATVLGTGPLLTHRFQEPGVYAVELEVRDSSGATSISATALRVGNAPPRLDFVQPRDGDFFDPSEALRWHVRVQDEEDGDSDDPDDRDPAWWMREVFLSAHGQAGVGLDARANDPPGLAAMRRSDCLSCHAVERRVVGPSFREVADRYRGVDAARAEAAQRIRGGSSGVWGTTPMRAHPDLDAGEVQAMLDWIFAQGEQGAEDATAVQLVGVEGRLDPANLAQVDATTPSVVVLEATYTDTGSIAEPDPVGALEARARVVLRTPRIEGEHAADLERTRILQSETASGGAFLGAIDHGARAHLGSMRLERVRGFRVRVSSAGSGGALEVHAVRKDDSAVLARFEIAPNGAWEDWYELEQTLDTDWPARLGDAAVALEVRFWNEEQPTALMNLDRIEVLLAP